MTETDDPDDMRQLMRDVRQAWLDREAKERRDAAGALRLAVDLLARQIADWPLPEGLSPARLAVLRALNGREPCTAATLADYMRIQPQSLTRMLAEMEAHGLISRRADRRQGLIERTELGKQLAIENLRSGDARIARAMKAALSHEEVGMLQLATTLLHRVMRALDAEAKAEATQSAQTPAAPAKPER